VASLRKKLEPARAFLVAKRYNLKKQQGREQYKENNAEEERSLQLDSGRESVVSKYLLCGL